MGGAKVNRRRLNAFFTAVLALVFVLSLSIHNHGFGPDGGERITKSAGHPGHSVEQCSACRLHGNLELPERDALPVLIDSPVLISFGTDTPLVPASFLTLYKSTRSPPLA
jgi:hypothetical protein